MHLLLSKNPIRLLNDACQTLDDIGNLDLSHDNCLRGTATFDRRLRTIGIRVVDFCLISYTSSVSSF